MATKKAIPKEDQGIYTAEMGNPPMEDDMGSATKYLKENKPPPPITAAPNKPVAKPVGKPEAKAKGGSIKSASSRADGIAQRGKTRA
jgi:hypothetical protein